MRAIKLTKIESDRWGSYSDTDDVGENGQQGPQTKPVTVNADAIRCFYPRKDNRPGTRITFIDGGGFAVTELYDAVEAAVSAA